MRNKEILIYKTWQQLSSAEQLVAKAKLIRGQNPKECKFGFNDKNEIVSVLDYGVLKDIFYI